MLHQRQTITQYEQTQLTQNQSNSRDYVGEIHAFLRSIGGDPELVDDRQLCVDVHANIYLADKNAAILVVNLDNPDEASASGRSGFRNGFIAATKRGLRMITLYSDEWETRRSIVESRLRSLMGVNKRIYARKCTIQESLPSVVVTECLDNWHIQGARSTNSNICLKHDGEVVAVLTYGKPRYGQEDIEIIRFASQPGVTVVGAFSRLLNRMIRITDANTVCSYSDNRWGLGTVYENAGLQLITETDPSYFYFKLDESPRRRYHRSSFQKHKIIQNYGGDPNLTEIQNMVNMGYTRVYDCGTRKWVWSRSRTESQ